MQLSPNFYGREFRCQCGCGQENVSPTLVSLLQKLRDQVGALKITSGVRCEKHNSTIGGAKRSWHVPRIGPAGIERGNAADITYVTAPGPMGILKLYVLADCFGSKGLGLYHNRVHVDVRPGRKARWIDQSWSWSRS